MAGNFVVITQFCKRVVSLYLLVTASSTQRDSHSQYGPSAQEVAEFLAGSDEPQAVAARSTKEMQALGKAMDELLQWVGAVPEPPLGRIRRVFGLADVDLFILAALLGPEIDPEIERTYCFAIDDFSKKRPDIGFLARMLAAGNPKTEDLILTRLADRAPLRKYGLLQVGQVGETQPATSRIVRVSDRIVETLRGHEATDESLRGVVQIASEPPTLADVIMDQDVVLQIKRGLGMAKDFPVHGAPRLLLAGPEGIGRAYAVEALAQAQHRQCVRIDLPALFVDSTARAHDRLSAAFREAALRDAIAIVDGGSTVKDEVPRQVAEVLAEACATLAVPIVFTLTTRPAWLANAVPELVELEVAGPTYMQRKQLWQRALPNGVASEEDLDTVAGRYAFGGAAIVRAARRALATARLRDPHHVNVTLDDLSASSRLTFSHRLGGMAQRIPTGFRWEDLVLPQETLDAVREVVRFARFRPFLLEQWGFAAKLPYGRGVSAILAGPPGTGKTMVAQLLASELGYDLYRIDLSQVVNKYIGETEKNLAKIFEEAESSHAVLFFDEADSLFAKRTEVKSSNDRYANLEVNYLLQRMETYDGVTLLATNIEQGLDEAFKRRVRFSVQFEMPEEEERKKLWISMFPPKVPLEEKIDWDGIARGFEMAGGYIKKAALRAALIAASNQRAVSSKDIFEAARLEYREMGRIVAG